MTSYQKSILGIVILSVVILVGSLWLYDKNLKKSKEKASISQLGEKVEVMASPHVEEGSPHAPYNSNPPTSGPHIGNKVAGSGIKDKQIADEIVVHSLEHGAVVVWYREGLEQSEVDKIKLAFNSSSGKKIMMPRKDLEVPLALVSWGYILKLNTIDQEKIKEFIEINNDRAPEKEAI